MNPDLLALFPDLLSRHVANLKQRGMKITGLCPFHSEKTPSFSANLEKGVYYCFGCGAKGGVVAFAKAVGEALPGRAAPPPPVQVRRATLSQDVMAEFRAWKNERWLDATAEIAGIDATLESLNACFRFGLGEEDVARLHQAIDEQGSCMLEAVARLDRYDPNPLVDDRAAQEEWIACQ